METMDRMHHGAISLPAAKRSKTSSLMDALQRLLELALDKIDSAGEFAEAIVIAMIDAIMGAAVEFIQTRRLSENALLPKHFVI
ncbi:MAG: hypothetical protein KJ630_16810 [Proteobacteria bacterium]|nr:hypothetical protein [Pseudomonadota bacterium]